MTIHKLDMIYILMLVLICQQSFTIFIVLSFRIINITIQLNAVCLQHSQKPKSN